MRVRWRGWGSCGNIYTSYRRECVYIFHANWFFAKFSLSSSSSRYPHLPPPPHYPRREQLQLELLLRRTIEIHCLLRGRVSFSCLRYPAPALIRSPRPAGLHGPFPRMICNICSSTRHMYDISSLSRWPTRSNQHQHVLSSILCSHI